MQYAKVEAMGDVPREVPAHEDGGGWRTVRIDPFARQLDVGAAYARECGALSNRAYLAELYRLMVAASPPDSNNTLSESSKK